MSTAATPATLWTPEQRAAIETRGGNLVVSASAGSGKTAVLTERVLRLVSEPGEGGAPPPALDRLLIVTFTEKAARQMRERIEARIRQGLAADPSSRTLRLALDALPSSWIMTLDALCRRIVLEHFHRAGVSPQSRIPEDAEASELESQAVQALLEQWAGDAARRDALQELLRGYPRGAADLAEDLHRILTFLDSLDRPELWLAENRARYTATLRAESFEALPEAREAAPAFRRATRELIEALRAAAAWGASRGGEPERLARWRALADRIEALAAQQDRFAPNAWREWIDRELNEVLGKIANKGQCGEALYRDKAFNSQVLGRFAEHYQKRWRDAWLALDEATLWRGARLAAHQCDLLLDLAVEARRRVGEVKARRGLLTFSDFAQGALKVLTDPIGGEGPSEIAHQYQQRFEHVLVDEYQDTSPLQDALIRRVSRVEDPTPGVLGNLFIVGDVKQSIYRFRHAEPLIFLEKIARAADPDASSPLASLFQSLHLLTNFRSRHAILHAVNACFERIMDEAVGEMEYGAQARLDPAPGRADAAGLDPVAVEVRWMARQAGAVPSDDDEAESGDAIEPPLQLEGLEAQAHWVARRIRELTDPASGLLIPDEHAAGTLRRARPGDCAILLRNIRNELDIWRRAIEAAGLQARTPGLSPLFTAPELIDLVQALRVADNPFQDVPLAALLRSPLAGFGDDELVRVRLAHPEGAFHEAVWAAAGRDPNPAAPSSALPSPLHRKFRDFAQRLDAWRDLARRGAATDVLERILNDTAYAAYLLGRPGGAARLEHLDYLRGLLARLAPTQDGANPLSGFLAILERVEREESELGDLPEPASEDAAAVSLLTIHKSKGLEFPIVFLPRLERRFHRSNITDTLFNAREGMARVGIDVEGRRRYATLAHRRLADEQHRRARAEEIRLLYVAMTRARERLVLVAQLPHLESQEARWRETARLADGRRGVLDRLHAPSPADLLGPAVAWLETSVAGGPPAWLNVTRAVEFPPAPPTREMGPLLQALQYQGDDAASQWRAAQQELALRAAAEDPAPLEPARLRLPPAVDPALGLTRLPAKTTVTQLRRGRRELEIEILEGDPLELDRFLEEEMRRPYFTRASSLEQPLGAALAARQPRWREGVATPSLSDATRRGTLTHQLLAGIELKPPMESVTLQREALRLVQRGIMGAGSEDDDPDALLRGLDWPALAWFFTTALGRRLAAEPGRVSRELPFTVRKALSDFAPETAAAYPTESILVQGVIDAVIDDGDVATVIDYKTDRIRDAADLAARAAAYDLQIEQYARALEAIWPLRRVHACLVFLDARQIVWRHADAPAWAADRAPGT